MFLAQIDLVYGTMDKLRKMTPEVYQRFRSELLEACKGSILDPWKLAEKQEELPKYDTSPHILADSVLMEFLDRYGIDYSIKKVKGLGSFERNIDGQRVIYQVSVPNVGLLQVDLVEALEDACTNDLQDKLNAGWRILAVCPPNDSRRPTYILGRSTYKPERG